MRHEHGAPAAIACLTAKQKVAAAVFAGRLRRLARRLGPTHHTSHIEDARLGSGSGSAASTGHNAPVLRVPARIRTPNTKREPRRRYTPRRRRPERSWHCRQYTAAEDAWNPLTHVTHVPHRDGHMSVSAAPATLRLSSAPPRPLPPPGIRSAARWTAPPPAQA